MDQPSHQDIINKLYDHDARLIRVEERQSAMSGEMHRHGNQISSLYQKVEKILEQLSQVDARQQIIFWLAVTLMPAIFGLELWASLNK